MDAATLTKLGDLAGHHWGLVTTAQAGAAGVSRAQLARMAAAGAFTRVAHGVYRMPGAPEAEHELTYATWLALGGSRFEPNGVPPAVAAGTTAANLHGIGNFYPDGYDFIVPARKGTRLEGVRFRIRQLTPEEFTFADGMPALTVERVIADLVEQWTDLSLVADTVRDAIDQGKLVAPPRLVTYLAPLAAASGYRRGDGAAFAASLYELADAKSAETGR
jgi:predicted transcriptional regulator of viral defense system